METGKGEVRVLARGLAILKAFEPANDWRSNTELAESTGLPKPTVSRLTANLTEAGYLAYSAQEAAYRLSTSVLTLGFVAASNRDLLVMVRPLMQEFADRYNVSVVLASADGDSIVCHEVAHGSSMLFTLRVRAGSRLQMGFSALGRALIGSMADVERERYLTKLGQLNPGALAGVQEHVKAAITQMKRKQYCTAAGSLEQGTNGVAVVIDTPDQPHSYAIGCAAPSNALSMEKIEAEVAPALLAFKNQLEAELSASTSSAEA